MPGIRTARQTVDVRPWVGCSHWTTPFRPHQSYSTTRVRTRDGLFDQPELDEQNITTQNDSQEREDGSPATEDGHLGMDTFEDGIIIDQIDARDLHANSDDLTTTPTAQPTHTRPTLPTSIKKLNRLLSHSRNTTIPESDLIEKFVKGRGPGGQAINKTNSSVSLIHIPTGIRIQSQPTRSREENRKIARKILGERLDLIRARAGSGGVDSRVETEAEAGGSRKDKERVLAKQFSRDEIRWEKERRRKSNKAKKAKKKHGSSASDAGPGSIGEQS